MLDRDSCSGRRAGIAVGLAVATTNRLEFPCTNCRLGLAGSLRIRHLALTRSKIAVLLGARAGGPSDSTTSERNDRARGLAMVRKFNIEECSRSGVNGAQLADERAKLFCRRTTALLRTCGKSSFDRDRATRSGTIHNEIINHPGRYRLSSQFPYQAQSIVIEPFARISKVDINRTIGSLITPCTFLCKYRHADDHDG